MIFIIFLRNPRSLAIGFSKGLHPLLPLPDQFSSVFYAIGEKKIPSSFRFHNKDIAETMTSPDFQIVEFTLRGVSFVFQGSSGSVMVTDGEDIFSLKERLDYELRRGLSHHIPADEQIFNALLEIGVPRSKMPIIKYTEEQPNDTLPPGAIS
jgi:hypothetical protein